MLIKDLIKLLEEEYKKQEPYIEMMGEPEVMMDVFEPSDQPHLFRYAGFDKEFIFDWSGDGVYRILRGFRDRSN